jgi:hypothetical protein
MNDAVRWAVGLAVACGVAWIAYPAGTGRLRAALLALRTAAALCVMALLLDVALGAAAPPAPLVALDVSASWRRSGDSAAFRVALDSARAAGRGAVWLTGDALRESGAVIVPDDEASRVTPAIERAVQEGRGLVLVTDGALDDADGLQRAPAGSRVIVVPTRVAPDRALTDLSAPLEARVGDTVSISVTVAASGTAGGAASVQFLLDASVLGTVDVPPLTDGGDATVDLRVTVPAGDSLGVLSAVLQSSGDVQPRNDTLRVAFRRGAAQRIVIVSSAPDADIRDVAGVLRSASAVRTETFYRVAPQRWVRDGSLTPVEESQVRTAARGATLVVLHGDTAALGAPVSLAAKSLLLLAPPPPDADGTELLVRTPPASPLQLAQANLTVDSLPPLFARTPARGEIAGLTAAAPGSMTGAMPVLALSENRGGRRIVVTAAGFNRWRSRGGVSALALQAVFGAAADWLLDTGMRAAGPVLLGRVWRAGEPLRWARGSDTSVALRLERVGRTGALLVDTLSFGTAQEVTRAPLTAGIWRGTVAGQPVLLPVNASREWLPQPRTVSTRTLGGEALPVRRGARQVRWFYLAAVLLFAAEWLLRRRAGLR